MRKKDHPFRIDGIEQSIINEILVWKWWMFQQGNKVYISKGASINERKDSPIKSSMGSKVFLLSWDQAHVTKHINIEGTHHPSNIYYELYMWVINGEINGRETMRGGGEHLAQHLEDWSLNVFMKRRACTGLDTRIGQTRREQSW